MRQRRWYVFETKFKKHQKIEKSTIFRQKIHKTVSLSHVMYKNSVTKKTYQKKPIKTKPPEKEPHQKKNLLE